MAAAAELPLAEFSDDRYVFIDDIDGLAGPRQELRDEAWATIEARRRLQQENASPTEHPEAFASPVDALSTARVVLATRDRYGLDSPEYEERRSGLRLDCQRLYLEWRRKLKSEIFEPVLHQGDQAGDFLSHGFSTSQLTRNALLPIPGDHEEEARRVNEFVEDAAPRMLRGLGELAVGMKSRTISQCKQKAIDDYEADVAAGRPYSGYDGYVPEVNKLMIRDLALVNGGQDRTLEQMALQGDYYPPEVVGLALKQHGLDMALPVPRLEASLEGLGLSAAAVGRAALHGSQILAKDDLLTGFMPVLDRVASEQWCANVFMGEVVPEDHPKDYEAFRREAQARQAEVDREVDTITTFVLDLTDDGVDSHDALPMVETFVKSLLIDESKKNLSLAGQIFDAKTADGLRRVVELESAGKLEQAMELLQEVEKAAPGGGFCGAGSCGLERAASTPGELQAQAGDKVVKDNVRKCLCGKTGGLFYAYSSRKVNKYCSHCGRFDSKTN